MVGGVLEPWRTQASYGRQNAAALAELGVPAFACTPDTFPDLMAAAIQGQPLDAWVDKHLDE